MAHTNGPTRREVLRDGLTAGAVMVGLGSAGAVAAAPGEGEENSKQFGRVWANDELWRTNVVNVLEEAPDPNDDIYFLNDGDESLKGVGGQGAPFVSESAPGDRDWNGGQWVHYSAEVTDLEAFEQDAPLTSESDVTSKSYIEITKGRPGFGPPDFFVCPLNGRA